MARTPLKDRIMDRPCDCTKSPAVALGPTCPDCGGTGVKERRCAQHWEWLPWHHFIGRRGGLVRRCLDCQKKYDNWGKKPLFERENATQPRSRIRDDGPLRVKFVVSSGNRKTGPIPVSMTSARTCPKSCSWYGRGCYAEQHMVAIHWRRVSDGEGIEWRDFVAMVWDLPEGQIWRHNEAGDLPGDDGKIDARLVHELVLANRGKRGFTYTHKPLNKKNLAIIREALSFGFAVNISADNNAEADSAAALGLPVTVVLPHDAPRKGNATPEGRPIVVCPAELSDKVTCERCGLCAVIERKSIIGFRAHGDRRGQITERLRQLPLVYA